MTTSLCFTLSIYVSTGYAILKLLLFILLMLLCHQLSPDYVGIELGIGESLLIKAISESTGRSNATVKADLKKEGDLGLVAQVSPCSRINAETYVTDISHRTQKTIKRLYSSQNL